MFFSRWALHVWPPILTLSLLHNLLVVPCLLIEKWPKRGFVLLVFPFISFVQVIGDPFVYKHGLLIPMLSLIKLMILNSASWSLSSIQRALLNYGVN